jgi:HD-like signal output (HDOD) protein
MTGLLSRLRTLFGHKKQPKQLKQSKEAKQQHATRESIEVTQPSTYSILTARYGFYDAVLGKIDDQKPLSVPQKLVQNIVLKSLTNKDSRIKAVPRLPSIIPKLVRTLKDPKSAVIDYIKIINKDPTISTTVLKLANSVYFNPTSKRITSVDTAVVKLGINGLRLVLSAAVLQPVIQRKSYFYTEFGQKLWVHSLHCAITCEAIAKQRALEPYKAYLLGLVHDIGKITVFSELSNQFQLNTTQDQPGYAAFAPLMQSKSETLSHLIAQDWELPEEICSALEQQINLKPGDIIGPYANVLFQANLITEIYAIANAHPEQKEAALTALADLKLPADLFQKLDSVNTEL